MFNFDRPIINQFPTGRWGFVGKVPVDLGYTQLDGVTPPTPEQAATAIAAGPRIAGIRTRTWDTQEEAQAALDAFLAQHYSNRPIA